MKGLATMTGLSAFLLLAACGGWGDVSANMTSAEAPAADAPVAMATPAVAASAAAPVATATPAVAADEESLDAFWTKFRKAALANDAATLRSLSAPVVEQHGELDDSPRQRLTPAQVPAVVAKILEKPDGIDDAGRTQRQLIEATPAPKRDAQRPADSFRFGDMEFERGASGWRLVRVYYEADE